MDSDPDERGYSDLIAAQAAAIVTALRPLRVFQLGGDPTLLAALNDRGVIAEGQAHSAILDQTPKEFDLALSAVLADRQDGPEMLAGLAVLAPRLLLSFGWPRGDAGRPLIWWLEQAAALGFSPVLGCDARFYQADAVLLQRDGAAVPPVLLAQQVELVRQRVALDRRDRALRAAERAFAERERRASLQVETVASINTAMEDRLRLAEASLEVARRERDAVLNARMWRLTAPLRRVLSRWRRHHHSNPAPALLATESGRQDAYQLWVDECGTLSEADRAMARARLAELPARPLISVVMPAYQTPPAQLLAAIASVQGQLYQDWELCIADDASPGNDVRQTVTEAAAGDPRIRFVRCAENGNISAATNAALALATGEFIALMDHDDVLAEDALYEVALELAAFPDADLLFSDEDQIDLAGRRTCPYFKPDWNIDLMLAHNMVSHLGVYRRALVQTLGGMRLGYEGSQDYDLALRVAAVTTPARIRHIPKVLYHWRQHATSFSQSRIDQCVAAARQAIADYLRSVGVTGAIVGPAPAIPTWTRLRWPLPETPPLVSVIVPIRDQPALLRQCVDGVLARTDYPELELIIVDNDSRLPETASLLTSLQQDARVRVLAAPGPFNYSAMNNAAVAVARGEILVLLNNDIDVIEPGWLTEMVGHALRPDVGAVGARLLYQDGSVQHAGVVLGVGTFEEGPGVAGHFCLAEPRSSFGYFGHSVLAHELSAVTAACLVLRKSVFQEVGGLDAERLPVSFNDVDLCLQIRAAGYRVIYTPYAELYHLESASRGSDLAPEHRERRDGECRTMRERWGRELDADRFYNPNFSREDGLFKLKPRSSAHLRPTR